MFSNRGNATHLTKEISELAVQVGIGHLPNSITGETRDIQRTTQHICLRWLYPRQLHPLERPFSHHQGHCPGSLSRAG